MSVLVLSNFLSDSVLKRFFSVNTFVYSNLNNYLMTTFTSI